jgi:hypothetical protein
VPMDVVDAQGWAAEMALWLAVAAVIGRPG